MSTDRTFDQLRPGAPGGPAQHQLADLLAAAAAPARVEELAREQDVMVAFRQARPAQTPVPRRQSMIKLALAKLLTVKVAAAAAAATVAGGAALAATGNIPGPLGELGSGELRQAPAESAAERADEARAEAGGVGEASPSPSLEGLCVAYLAAIGEGPGEALESPAFEALVSAAGTEDEVEGFCDGLAERPGDVPSVEPDTVPTDRTPVELPKPEDPGPPGTIPAPEPPPGTATDR